MEKVPRKKKRQPLKGRTVLLILLCCAALAGGGLYILRSLPVSLPPVSEKETVLLLSRPEEDIASVAIAPRGGTAYPLIRQGNTFALLGQEAVALRSDILDDLMVTLTELPVENTVLQSLSAAQGLRPSDFGLDPALARVTVTYTDGEKKELRVGNLTPDEETPQRYCMVSGSDTLYTILEADSVPLLREMDSLRDFAQPAMDGSLLDRIEITGQIEWVLHYTPSGWQMDAPFSYPLSAQRTDALLKKIESMGFAACLGHADKLNLKDYGLDTPALTITLTQAATVITGETADGEQVSVPVPETVYTLRIGSETGKSGVYVQWQDQVFTASNFLLGFWKELEPLDYLLQTPVNLLVNDLNEVRFTRGGGTHAYQVRMVEQITENNQIAVDEYGRVLYDCAVNRAGETQDMDAEAFLAWYTRLASLAGDGRLPEGWTPEGAEKPRAEIVLVNDHLTRTITLWPYDALHDAIAVDGVALSYIRNTWLDEIGEAP
ncbi:MAG: DUF4340 domain-containing protein [Clostridia bacterium]|nr:DUF4340 domain-containing protein [Clostridia bacterium]